MGIPVWVTDRGNLGTLQEGEFYEISLVAEDPDSGSVSLKVISGYMPPGMVLDEESGRVYGRPKDFYFSEGVPLDVTEDTTSKFCIRATSSTTGQIADRTFSITVTGQDAPQILTESQELARVVDGSFVDIDIVAVDLDREPLEWSVVSGELPPGVSLNTATGKISGYVEPAKNIIDDQFVGWDNPNAGWNEYAWDQGETWVSKNYQFSIRVSDGKEYSSNVYTIFVYSKNLLTADNSDITADDISFITADQDTRHKPIITTESADLGIFEHDNYFAYQFSAIDFDGDDVEFGLGTAGLAGFDEAGFDVGKFDQGNLLIPTGLEFNRETGWLYGYLETQIRGQIEYNFTVYAYKKSDPDLRSEEILFSLTTVNDLRDAVIWRTDRDLGVINTGEISELQIKADNASSLNLFYNLAAGSRLPQGLKMTEKGLIVGRPSFEVTSFDQDKTTFDINVRELGADVNESTFDRQAVFTVEVTSSGGEIFAARTFTVTVNPENFAPYENLYLRALPGPDGKDLFKSIANDNDVFPEPNIYRSNDSYFGRPRDPRMLLLSGLNISEMQEYISAMSQNHYRKRLAFGEPKTTTAYDENQNPIYDVVYYEINDPLENQQGSVNKKIDLNGKINRTITVDYDQVTVDDDLLTLDDAGSKIVYPNSLKNMRRQLIDQLGLNSREYLPQWMGNRRPDGTVLGWRPAVVLAYLRPGTGEESIFKLKRKYPLDQISIDFEVDRFIIDNNMSSVYDISNDQYKDSNQTTFDAFDDALIPPSAEVDFALSKPFSEYHGRTAEYIYNIDGLDGLQVPLDGKTVIFAEQELYTGYNIEFDGWAADVDFWDSADGWDNGAWGEYQKVSGYAESQANSSIANQRAGVWRFVYDSENQFYLLEFVKEINLGETVAVKEGFEYGNTRLRYGPNIRFDQGRTVPYYEIFDTSDLQGNETVFDSGTTRFISNITVYEDPDVNDKYLVFPRRTIWA